MSDFSAGYLVVTVVIAKSVAGVSMESFFVRHTVIRRTSGGYS